MRYGAYTGVAFFVLVILVFVMVSMSGCLQSSLRLNVKVNSTGPGWIGITLSANTNISNATLNIARPAKLLNCSGNTCYFSYWFSPSDPSGKYEATYAIETNGKWYHGKISVPLEFGVNVTKVDGVYFYGENLTHVLSSFNTSDIIVLARFTPNRSEANAQVVKAEVIVIAALKALNKTVYFYALTPENCTFVPPEKGLSWTFPPERCKSVPGPKIVIDLPDYPTDQVFVGNKTIELQGKDLKSLATNTMYVLAKYLKRGTV